ncbi:MAG: TIGR04282 family arsenosugar biosynthesis glycosyltransferase [Haliscomenobacter sp.]|uniref:TIGR04282 family arsenosugar biosynthesis glycosyltransferase n=1 Tax=Haliscomenobacter sp. TaxID=2717303 RepID=UPI0029A8020B|nr:TIGR04282 family arsenosugar biosynthesis glycosyltransferase [Haliscomenobacter sp.]MDX2070988.1 TIGR04282 family arsenosugar biosynthesis glycosyltransferase [Haliscomenobacter sp.]
MSLIIFIKNPALGKVKTRLAATIGDEAALAVYHKLSHRAREMALVLDVPRHLFYSDFIDDNDAWDKALFIKKQQVGQDLGERMHLAFVDTLQTSSKAVIIGSDCPLLTSEIVQLALDQLDEYPFVLGPALDGGYYLLGMRKPTPALFENMEWSTENVAKITLERMAESGAPCYLLPALPDVDVEEDWQKYGW